MIDLCLVMGIAALTETTKLDHPFLLNFFSFCFANNLLQHVRCTSFSVKLGRLIA